jgi:hypothetical protein
MNVIVARGLRTRRRLVENPALPASMQNLGVIRARMAVGHASGKGENASTRASLCLLEKVEGSLFRHQLDQAPKSNAQMPQRPC